MSRAGRELLALFLGLLVTRRGTLLAQRIAREGGGTGAPRTDQTTHLSANLPGDLEALRITSGRIDLLQKSE